MHPKGASFFFPIVASPSLSNHCSFSHLSIATHPRGTSLSFPSIESPSFSLAITLSLSFLLQCIPGVCFFSPLCQISLFPLCWSSHSLLGHCSLFLSLYQIFLSLPSKTFTLSLAIALSLYNDLHKHVHVYAHTNVYIYVYMCDIIAFIHTFINLCTHISLIKIQLP